MTYCTVHGHFMNTVQKILSFVKETAVPVSYDHGFFFFINYTL